VAEPWTARQFRAERLENPQPVVCTRANGAPRGSQSSADRMRKHMPVREAIVGYIEEVSHESGFEHSMNLFEGGLLTSLDVLSLVAFIEDTFDVHISGDDVDMDSFGTVNGLVSLITAKQAQAGRQSCC
jgi:acyl carrier protein